MPATLLAALPHRPGPRIQSTLVSLWGLDEELRFIENLEQETIAKLEIEYRPGRHVGRNRLAEISHYLKRLLTGLVGLNTLMIDFSCGPRHRFIDLVQMDVQELLPPVENLGLDHCHCGSVRQGIQVHIRWGSLRRLSLRSCKGTSYLFREARGQYTLLIVSPFLKLS